MITEYALTIDCPVCGKITPELFYSFGAVLFGHNCLGGHAIDVVTEMSCVSSAGIAQECFSSDFFAVVERFARQCHRK